MTHHARLSDTNHWLSNRTAKAAQNPTCTYISANHHSSRSPNPGRSDLCQPTLSNRLPLEFTNYRRLVDLVQLLGSRGALLEPITLPKRKPIGASVAGIWSYLRPINHKSFERERGTSQPSPSPANVQRPKPAGTVSASTVGKSSTERRISTSTTRRLRGQSTCPMNATSHMNTSLIVSTGSTHFTNLPTTDGNAARHGYLTAPSTTTSRPLPPPCPRHVSRTCSRSVPRWSAAAHELQPASSTAADGDSMPLLQEAQGEPTAS